MVKNATIKREAKISREGVQPKYGGKKRKPVFRFLDILEMNIFVDFWKIFMKINHLTNFEIYREIFLMQNFLNKLSMTLYLILGLILRLCFEFMLN